MKLLMMFRNSPIILFPADVVFKEMAGSLWEETNKQQSYVSVAIDGHISPAKDKGGQQGWGGRINSVVIDASLPAQSEYISPLIRAKRLTGLHQTVACSEQVYENKKKETLSPSNVRQISA